MEIQVLEGFEVQDPWQNPVIRGVHHVAMGSSSVKQPLPSAPFLFDVEASSWHVTAIVREPAASECRG